MTSSKVHLSVKQMQARVVYIMSTNLAEYLLHPKITDKFLEAFAAQGWISGILKYQGIGFCRLCNPIPNNLYSFKPHSGPYE